MPVEKPKMKSSKPLMEKRRRARINDSLMQLKNLVLDALNKNNSRHSKLEKADILEMTVRYLRTIQRQQISASVNADPAVLGQYRSGYAQCINEVTRYLGASANGPDGAPELRTRLVGHLADMCTTGQQLQQQQVPTTTPLSQQQQQSPVKYQLAQTTYQPHQQRVIEGAMAVPQMQVINVQQPSSASVPVRIAPTPEGTRTEYSFRTTSEPHGQMSPIAVRTQSATNSSPAQVIQSVSVGVAGSTLPSGEITLLLPQESLPNGQVPTHFIPVYAPPGSAAAVLSPPLNTNNNPGSNPTPCPVSMSSPRAASTVPSMSPTSPQSSMTIPAQHAQVIQPLSSHPPQAQVTYRVPVQTRLSPVAREYTHQQPEPVARELVAAAEQHVAKSDPMWRPW
ncbi:uncharacterized protein [Amphiura filiformis]|uniref:uncharacterized protein n=1 Tax=Amphiura filiformis TaxID=82378 RepID=UPI003B2150FF